MLNSFWMFSTAAFKSFMELSCVESGMGLVLWLWVENDDSVDSILEDELALSSLEMWLSVKRLSGWSWIGFWCTPPNWRNGLPKIKIIPTCLGRSIVSNLISQKIQNPNGFHTISLPSRLLGSFWCSSFEVEFCECNLAANWWCKASMYRIVSSIISTYKWNHHMYRWASSISITFKP